MNGEDLRRCVGLAEKLLFQLVRYEDDDLITEILKKYEPGV